MKEVVLIFFKIDKKYFILQTIFLQAGYLISKFYVLQAQGQYARSHHDLIVHIEKVQIFISFSICLGSNETYRLVKWSTA